MESLKNLAYEASEASGKRTIEYNVKVVWREGTPFLRLAIDFNGNVIEDFIYIPCWEEELDTNADKLNYLLRKAQKEWGLNLTKAIMSKTGQVLKYLANDTTITRDRIYKDPQIRQALGCRRFGEGRNYEFSTKKVLALKARFKKH